MAERNHLTWRKSTRSSSGDCVEIAVPVDADVVLMRDSKDPDGPTLTFDRDAFADFLAALKDSGQQRG